MQFRRVLRQARFVVIAVPIEKERHVAIVFNLPGLLQVGQDRALIGAVSNVALELMQGQNGNVELTRADFTQAAIFRSRLVFLPPLHQSHIVNRQTLDAVLINQLPRHFENVRHTRIAHFDQIERPCPKDVRTPHSRGPCLAGTHQSAPEPIVLNAGVRGQGPESDLRLPHL